jgi:tetratricopeptide (TPR) repeat protein
MLLARVQTERNDLAAARRTVDRLKLIDPFSWGTAVEQARLLAKTDKAAAAKALLSHRFAEKPETLLYPIAVTLEGLGCAADARKIYQNWYETEKRPDRHIPLTEFLIRQKDGNAALDLAFKHATDIPPGRTARLLSGAVQSRKIELVPAAEKEAWRKRVDEATKWVAEQASKDPMRPELLLARAELADAAGQYPDSMRLYGEAADRTEDKALKANLRNNRAWLLAVFGQDRSDEPLRLVNEAINARGPMPYFLDTRSMVRLAANQPEEALVDLDAILPSDTNGTYYFHRAIVLDRMNKIEARAEAVAEAAKRGLTRESIHPLEWPIYDRLFKK